MALPPSAVKDFNRYDCGVDLCDKFGCRETQNRDILTEGAHFKNRLKKPCGGRPYGTEKSDTP